jgi:hypothetical protein
MTIEEEKYVESDKGVRVVLSILREMDKNIQRRRYQKRHNAEIPHDPYVAGKVSAGASYL